MALPEISYNLASALETADIGKHFEALTGAGVKFLALLPVHLKKFREECAFRQELLREAEKNHLVLRDAHAPHGIVHSLGNPLPDGNCNSLTALSEALLTAADIGCVTMTVHAARTRLMGDFAALYKELPFAEVPQALSRAQDVLEKLLVPAEKHNVTVAVENLFLPSGTADAVSFLVEKIKHPHLGLCYDSGHALLLEKVPGKTSGDIAPWIRCGWDEETVVFQQDQLDRMLDNVVTAHLHDNHGIDDEHLPPGEGVINWQSVADRLAKAPRLLTLQSEVDTKYFFDRPGVVAGWFKEFKNKSC